METPRFTAETSLYATPRSYRNRSYPGSIRTDAFVPQQRAFSSCGSCSCLPWHCCSVTEAGNCACYPCSNPPVAQEASPLAAY